MLEIFTVPWKKIDKMTISLHIFLEKDALMADKWKLKRLQYETPLNITIWTSLIRIKLLFGTICIYTIECPIDPLIGQKKQNNFSDIKKKIQNGIISSEIMKPNKSGIKCIDLHIWFNYNAANVYQIHGTVNICRKLNIICYASFQLWFYSTNIALD